MSLCKVCLMIVLRRDGQCSNAANTSCQVIRDPVSYLAQMIAPQTPPCATRDKKGRQGGRSLARPTATANLKITGCVGTGKALFSVRDDVGIFVFGSRSA